MCVRVEWSGKRRQTSKEMLLRDCDDPGQWDTFLTALGHLCVITARGLCWMPVFWHRVVVMLMTMIMIVTMTMTVMTR